MNCRHCAHYSREKNGEYCEKWCKDFKKSFCTKGFCDKTHKCVYGEEPACEKANQIKQEWLQTQYDNISKIASIDIRR